MTLRPAFLAASLAVALLGGAGAARAGDVLVFAASSLGSALNALQPVFTEETGHRMIVSLAGSSTLARQIQQGAPADVFISANVDWMDVLDQAGALAEGTRADLLTNGLVLIAHGLADPIDLSRPADLSGALADGRLAMALVDAVPAGIYGHAALQSLGLWDSVAAQIAQTDNVRAALALVATGEAPLGVVYATDTTASSEVSIVASFPADSHPPIVYPVAAIAGHETDATLALLRFLRSTAARAEFTRQGFGIAGE